MLFAQQAPPASSGVPLGLILAVLSGLMLLGSLLWGLRNPWVWVIVAVLSIGGGVGCLVWGLTQARLLGEQRPARELAEASALIGGGAGAMAGGLVLLAAAWLRCRRVESQQPISHTSDPLDPHAFRPLR